MRGGVVKKGTLALLILAVAAAAFGDLSKYKDWSKSPEAYFLTPPEREEWAKLKTDDEAEKFIAQYWAKRGGEIFKQEISRRIDAADQQFKMRRHERGALSARGRLLVTLGPPSKQLRERAEEAAGNPRSSGDVAPEAANLLLTWTFDKGRFPADWGIGELRIRILVDQVRGIDELQAGSAVEKAIATIAEKSIAPVSAKTIAVSPTALPAAASASAAPAPVAATLPAAVRANLEAAAREKRVPEGSFWGGPFRTLAGDPLYAFELTLPAPRAAAGAKFGGLVTTEAGDERVSFWEDATLTDSKTGTELSKVFIRSVALAPGSYRGAFGLFSLDGSAVLVTAAPEFKLESRSRELEVSPLILTSVLEPLGKRAQPDAPFIFGKPEKPIQIVPKANRLFTNQEALWYFVAIGNPAKPAQVAAPPAAAATPAAAAVAPSPAPEPARPRLMATINVMRDGKPAYLPATAPIEPEAFGQDFFGEGKEIPLKDFQPGRYALVIKLRDLNAPPDSPANKGVERSADFTVLKADGSMPDRPIPTPTPAPTKPPTKAPVKKS
jgi:GWxTD domain-containing protein